MIFKAFQTRKTTGQGFSPHTRKQLLNVHRRVLRLVSRRTKGWGINNSKKHLTKRFMVELAGQVLGKLEAMSDAEFAEVALEAAE